MKVKKGECALVPHAARRKGNCEWCGIRLPRTKAGQIHKTRRWCTRSCAKAYSVNHFWKLARQAALIRDGNRCTKCGKAPSDMPYPVHDDYPNLAKYHQAIEDWQEAIKPLRLEVHHLKPVQGNGYSQSCLHHQSNLLTLCHSCHRQKHS